MFEELRHTKSTAPFNHPPFVAVVQAYEGYQELVVEALSRSNADSVGKPDTTGQQVVRIKLQLGLFFFLFWKVGLYELHAHELSNIKYLDGQTKTRACEG